MTLNYDFGLLFPTCLRELRIDGEGTLLDSNIHDVALESLEYSPKFHFLTEYVLEGLPKTLRRIQGNFEPASLKQSLHKTFPLIEAPKNLFIDH